MPFQLSPCDYQKIWSFVTFSDFSVLLEHFGSLQIFLGISTSLENARNGVFRSRKILFFRIPWKILNFWSQKYHFNSKNKIFEKTQKYTKNEKIFLPDHFDGPQLFFGGRTSLENARNGVFRSSRYCYKKNHGKILNFREVTDFWKNVFFSIFWTFFGFSVKKHHFC